MGCNCGGKNKQTITAAQAEEMRQQSLLEQRIQEVSNQSSTGEHAPDGTRALPRIVRR